MIRIQEVFELVCPAALIWPVLADQRSDTGAGGAVRSDTDLQLNTVSVQHNRPIHSPVNLCDFYRSFTWRLSSSQICHCRTGRDTRGPLGLMLTGHMAQICLSQSDPWTGHEPRTRAHLELLKHHPRRKLMGKWCKLDRYKIKHSTSQKNLFASTQQWNGEVCWILLLLSCFSGEIDLSNVSLNYYKIY